MMRNWFLLLGFVLTISSYAQSFEKLGSIELQGLNETSSRITSGKDFVVLLFLGTDCPVSQKYMHRISELKKQFGATADFFAIIPKQFTVEEIKDFKLEYESTMTFFRDKEMAMTSYLNAKVTPEVFLLDKNDILKYRGAIDNWFYELGKYRKVTSEQYLIDALQQVIKGSDPLIKETEAIGCLIQRPMEMDHHNH